MDLIKAFDKVDWIFLRFVLIQSGLSVEVTNWIMGCVSSANFAILINGHPSNFFRGQRGLRQGCPLSPLLFLMVIERLRLLIKNAKSNGWFWGFSFSPSLIISHLLFVDDVLIFGRGVL